VNGTNHQEVVKGRAPRHRGVLMGRVAQVDADCVVIETGEAHEIAPLKEGDGLVFDAADWRSPGEPEEGGRVYEVTRLRDGKLKLGFANRAIRFDRIRPGDQVWRSSDAEVTHAARFYTDASVPVHKQPVRVRVEAHAGSPLMAEWSLVSRPELCVTVKSPGILAAAQNRAISTESVREQFSRLGNTAYELAELDLDAEGSPFAPVSMLNQIRREAVDKLRALQGEVRDRVVNDPFTALVAARLKPLEQRTGEAFELHLLVRTPEQLEAAIELTPASITLDYLDLYGLRPSVERVKASGIVIRVASPRVLKPGEARILNFLVSLECQILVRSTGILQALREKEHPFLIGDFSLNAANSLSAAEYLKLVSRLTPTHDLNAAQVADLAGDAGAQNLEVVAYQHLPVFHTEHCVFCRFLSDGTSYKDCGRPCEKHRVELRDHAGRSHPVMADVGCRNTVFGAEAQEASAHLDLWRAAGIRHFRLEFVHESAEQVREVARLFRLALAGDLSAPQLNRALKATAPEGTTQGSLFVPSNYLALTVLQ
jgi:U32 family peptidase